MEFTVRLGNVWIADVANYLTFNAKQSGYSHCTVRDGARVSACEMRKDSTGRLYSSVNGQRVNIVDAMYRIAFGK